MAIERVEDRGPARGRGLTRAFAVSIGEALGEGGAAVFGGDAVEVEGPAEVTTLGLPALELLGGDFAQLRGAAALRVQSRADNLLEPLGIGQDEGPSGADDESVCKALDTFLGGPAFFRVLGDPLWIEESEEAWKSWVANSQSRSRVGRVLPPGHGSISRVVRSGGRGASNKRRCSGSPAKARSGQLERSLPDPGTRASRAVFGESA